MKRAVAESGIHLTMLLPMRFEPTYAVMQRIVAAGRIGEVALIAAQKSYKLGEWPEWIHRNSHGRPDAFYQRPRPGSAWTTAGLRRCTWIIRGWPARAAFLEFPEGAGLTLMIADDPPRSIHVLPLARRLFPDFLDSVYNGTQAGLRLPEIYRANEIVLAARESAGQHTIMRT